MKCPLDGSELAITYRDGVEIDYCPKCRGIWLDRGELDKLLDLGARYAPRSGSYSDDDPDDAHDYDEKAKRTYERGYNDRDDKRGSHTKYGKKRRSFLDEIFDIFD